MTTPPLSRAGATYCEVIVEIAHENVSRLFTYRVPEGMTVVPGMRVLAPFGPRQIEGYALRVSDAAPDGVAPEKIRPITRTLEDYPALLPALAELARWLSEKTHCLLVEAIRLMLPAEMRGGRVRPKNVQWARIAADQAAVEQEIAGRAARRAEILRLLLTGDRPAAELRKISAEGVANLAARGIIALYDEETRRRPATGGAEQAAHTLTEDQCDALDALLPAMRRGEGRFLLSGVTGSGKTEVYMRAVREALKDGKTAIVLVPEIALTPQMAGWFHQRFGEAAAVLHSRLSAGERFDEWRRVRRGEARVVVGARSAVFAPVENLGIIIVDEEHETTYRSDTHPRYDAREVAQRRCDTERATLLLSSATPSMESFARAMHGAKSSLGPLALLEMPRRVLGRPMPEVTVVDMREELVRGNRTMFSRELDLALCGCVEKGEQAMLFINRRGHSTFVSCRSCGKALKCPHCDVSLTYHRSGRAGDALPADVSPPEKRMERMRCHYCGHTARVPEACPACGSGSIKYFGSGTQKVEEAVRQRYRGVKTVRMDFDTTQGKDAHAKLLNQFRSGGAQILIGTQMIAKGLDFPRVTLVGVVAADATLQLPDYRSAERAFSLIVQVAGRAGRGDTPGRVIVQTYCPEHYAIAAAQKQDFRAFFTQEFGRRRRSLYPPFTKMVRLLVEGGDEETVQRAAESLYAEAEAFFAAQPVLLQQVVQMRAMEAPIRMIRGKFRWQVFLKLYSRGDTERILAALNGFAQKTFPGAAVYLEIDPVAMV